MKKLILLIMIGMFLISLTSASLGTYKQNECVDIKTILNSTWVNISTISNPDSDVIYSQQEMTKIGQTFNFTFCNTTDLGTYIYDYYDNNGKTYVNDFDITPSGLLLNIGILITIIFIVLILFILSFYKVFNSNTKLEFMIFSILSYFLLLIFIFMSWKISENYLYNMEWIISLFYVLFIVILVLMFPFIIGLIAYLFYNIFTERNMKEMTAMGYSPEEAKRFK